MTAKSDLNTFRINWGGPTRGFIGHQHTNMCDRPVGVVQQTGIDLDGKSVVCSLNHVHQLLIVLNN